MALDKLIREYGQFSPSELSFISAVQEELDDYNDVGELANQTLRAIQEYFRNLGDELEGGSVRIIEGDELLERGRIKETPETLEGVEELITTTYESQRTTHNGPYLAIPTENGVFFVYNKQGFIGPQIHLIKKIASLAEKKIKNKKANEELSDIDALTSLQNRRTLERAIDYRVRTANRYNESFSFAMIDIDHFRDHNERIGHLGGDYVLTEVSRIIREKAGEKLSGRYGGEEFSLLFPGKDLETAQKETDEIRKAIENEYFEYKGIPIRITISAGVAQLKEEENKLDLVARADKALYTAKQSGRNQTVKSV